MAALNILVFELISDKRWRAIGFATVLTAFLSFVFYLNRKLSWKKLLVVFAATCAFFLGVRALPKEGLNTLLLVLVLVSVLLMAYRLAKRWHRSKAKPPT
jgi:uncharacterized membrane protein YfcA